MWGGEENLVLAIRLYFTKVWDKIMSVCWEIGHNAGIITRMYVYLWIDACILMNSCICTYELLHAYLWTDACVLMNWCVYTYELMHVYLWTSACVLTYFCMCTYALYAIYNASSKLTISILVLASSEVLQDFHLSLCPVTPTQFPGVRIWMYNIYSSSIQILLLLLLDLRFPRLFCALLGWYLKSTIASSF